VRLQSISIAGLFVYGFAVTFTSIQWQMALEPKRNETIRAILFPVSQTLCAWSFTILIIALLASRLREPFLPAEKAPAPIEMKTKAAYLAPISAAIFFARILDRCQLIEPAFHPNASCWKWTSSAIFLGLGGIWSACFLEHLKKHSFLNMQ
jgi:hypothetical protein